MKMNTRVTLRCYKRLKNAPKPDMFTVVVAADDVQNKKKYYEQMGYEVTVL